MKFSLSFIVFSCFHLCYFELVLATENASNIFVNEPNNFLFYSRGFQIKFNQSSVKINDRPTIKILNIVNKTNSVALMFNLTSDGLSHVEIKINFIKNYFGWEINKMLLTIKCDNVKTSNCTSLEDAVMVSQVIAAPLEMSYHCMKQIFTVNDSFVKITFDKFQVAYLSFHPRIILNIIRKMNIWSLPTTEEEAGKYRKNNRGKGKHFSNGFIYHKNGDYKENV